MNGKHFEIGTIQAFLDGETTPDVSLWLTNHVASCDVCARLLATAEEESSFVFSALERELNTLVPSQRLWTRINEGIAVEDSRATVWQKIFVYVRIGLVNPSITAAAGVILVVGLFAILWMPKSSETYKVDNGPSGPPPQGPTKRDATIDPIPDPVVASADSNGNNKKNGATYVKESNLSPRKLGQLIDAVDKRPVDVPTPQNARATDSYLPGEESYVRTIADLKESVDTQKDEVLTPSTRVSYERDMAVVNDSIERMRKVVRKNPRNQAARQVLYASYQDKIDLLNSVAEREELMASLR